MISHEHKFIYTRIGKTASVSVAHALSSLMTDKPTEFDMNHWHPLDLIDERSRDYFKFTFVRNPWDRCVSFYHFTRDRQISKRTEKYIGTTFEDFIRSPAPPFREGDDTRFVLDATWAKHSPTLYRLYTSSHPLENQIDWLLDGNGKMIPDFIGRFENLQEDFGKVCDILGFGRIVLEHENSTPRKNYKMYYSDETRQIVAERYARDIEAFGYTFD